MTPREAKETLLLYRPGMPEEADPQMVEALALARHDPELGEWFTQHCAFQQMVRTKLRASPVPGDLKERLLAERKIVRPTFWQQRPMWLAAAAALVLLLGIAALQFRRPTPDRFADFRSRMVRTALREYRMDVVTNDMESVRAFMASSGAPADYELPDGLAKLTLTGGGRLEWRGHSVAMVCFDRGDKEMLYLFVLPRSATKAPPADAPQFERVNRLITASWTRGDRVYLLAGPEERDFERKYL